MCAEDEPGPDAAVNEVAAWFNTRTDPDLENELGQVLRKALDEVIDGGRTGRWSVNALEKTEKTYIGTKVEILLKYELGLGDGQVLDTTIEGNEVDIKCTVGGKYAWMIPAEAVGRICLLVSVNDARGYFRVGLLRTTTEVLTPRGNRDGKRGIRAAARPRIIWLVEEGQLPANFLSTIPEEIRARIMAHRTGQARINELFRLVQGRIISRNALETVARQLDPMRRMRGARSDLRREGILVLGHQEGDPATARGYGLVVPTKGDAISFRPTRQ